VSATVDGREMIARYLIVLELQIAHLMEIVWYQVLDSPIVIVVLAGQVQIVH
jgi:hypothetical protein